MMCLCLRIRVGGGGVGGEGGGKGMIESEFIRNQQGSPKWHEC